MNRRMKDTVSPHLGCKTLLGAPNYQTQANTGVFGVCEMCVFDKSSLFEIYNAQPNAMLTIVSCSCMSPFQAPSLPNSAVHSSLFLISSAETVGLALLIALMKSLTCSGGSSSLSESTSVHDISIAPLSPGEQGVSFSWPSTLTLTHSESASNFQIFKLQMRRMEHTFL